MFKRRRFPVEIILLCVHWYCKDGISYRDLVETMQEHGVEVDPSTIIRWVHRYAPELEKRVRWYRAASWREDETYVKVGGRWKYLFRAVDKQEPLPLPCGGITLQPALLLRKSVSNKIKFSHRGLHRTIKDERNSHNGVPET